ncbi:MAG: hypothetical protein A2Y90_04555 [Chloroflexi bacterium RBG_13_52_12]|nr:MAG: hypothetical protein A2Y90_04555 [Chloroflexi bacterium RBG_13_52_12]
MTQGNSVTPSPSEFPHIFVEIAWQIVPEVSYGDLVYLSQLAKQAGNEESYELLVDCLRKIQWAKIAGKDAIAIENEIEKQCAPDIIVVDYVGQVRYQKSLFDFIANGKASLDSLAVFLNTFLGLGKKGGERDFRKVSFCQTVCSHDDVIGKYIKTLAEWLDKDRRTSDSIVATRDEWLHRGRPVVKSLGTHTEMGCLPIPKTLTSEFPGTDMPLTNDYYWKTQEFFDFHLQRLFTLFVVVVNRCITIEEKRTPKPIRRDLLPIHTQISALPMRAINDIKIKKIRFRT